MEIRCHTPFVPLVFRSTDAAGTDYDVVVVKATYDLVDEARVRMSPEQAPITMADAYFGEAGLSSVHLQSDLAPFKPRADFVVIGDAHPPASEPSRSWTAEVGLGDTQKAVRVTGPRWWQRESESDDWSLSEPAYTMRVPVRYEHAFGGLFRRDEDTVDAFRQNPVGVGWIPGDSEALELPAPQVEDPETPIESHEGDYAAAGFGFIGRSWTPRLELAGTYDDAWKENQWPRSPLDWDDAYNNGAHPDLQLPYLQGGERFVATHMSESGRVEFTVPHWRVDIRFRYRVGSIVRHPTNLDTCVVDLHAQKVFFSYRVRVPVVGPLRVVEVCMNEAKG